MIIICPICGERDLREFQYLGSAKLMERPEASDLANPTNEQDQNAFYDYVYIRENPEGPNAELWLHEYGCRAYIRAMRNTKTHEFLETGLVRNDLE